MINKEIYGKRRQRLDLEEYEILRKTGAVSLDYSRSRPFWFDGRFLKAADLNQEQNYLLSRMSDMALAAGPGIVNGLSVTETANNTVTIGKGYGTTFDGELVELQDDFTVNINDIPLSRELQVRLGAQKKIIPPLRQRSGLFVLALRPLEFSANPTVSYPTHIDETRSSEDGEIVEATAVTLIPYAATVMGEDMQIRRARAADKIFVRDGQLHSPSYTLPLAMVELSMGRVRWVDPYLVRRDIHASSQTGLGLSPRQMREAHFHQFQQHLPLVAERSPGPMTAADHFLSLPPIGQMPAASVDLINKEQSFFPSSMDIEVSIIPEDELPALIAESLLLPPIDLTASEDELEATPVMVLIPVARATFFTKKTLLGPKNVSFTRKSAPKSRTPAMIVNKLWDKHFITPGIVKPSASIPLTEQSWQSLLTNVDYIWYTRRRSLNINKESLGKVLAFTTESDAVMEEAVLVSAERVGKTASHATVKAKGTAKGISIYNDLLYTFKDSRIILADAITKAEVKEKIDEKVATEIATEYQKEHSGEGLKKLENTLIENETNSDKTINMAARKRNNDRIEAIVASGQVVEFDKILATMEPAEVAKVAEKMNVIMTSDSLEVTKKENIKTLISKMGARK